MEKGQSAPKKSIRAGWPGCRVWYRHSGEELIDKIPLIKSNDLKTVRDVSDILCDIGEHYITHMYIRGEMPPSLSLLAPRLVDLQLYGTRQMDGLSALTSLERLNISGNKQLATLPSAVCQLMWLKRLDLSCSSYTKLPIGLSALTSLEELDISMNEQLTTLPPVICKLTSLKRLNLSVCGYTDLPIDLSALTSLEVLDISNNPLTTLPAVVCQLKSLRILDLSCCSYTDLPMGLSALTSLEGLNISSNALTTLPADVCQLSTLTTLNMSACDYSELPIGLSALTSLEVFDISWNKQLATLPPDVCKLSTLKILNLSACNYTKLPDGLSDLTSLEVLNISWNKKLTTLPPDVCQLQKLKILNLSACDYKTIPTGLSALASLEVLDISSNKRFTTLSAEICRLRSLKVLDLSDCGYTELPKGLSALASLEVLDISSNKLTILPADICQLRTLKTLNMFACNFTKLPISLKSFQQLETLDIGSNEFNELPAVIYQLTNLRTLNLQSNMSLERIDKCILNLCYLESVDCEDCEALHSPPYAVCNQGLPAIRKYFEDLEVESVIELTVIPVAVIGARMVGKTSIIRSLQVGRRILTDRTQSAELDEATKVFKIEKLALDNAQVMFTDFGGHDVYHIAYQLTINKTYVPCIVLSMQQYDELACRRGAREATRRLCYDWMSHLYLPCPDLDSPILVLTHKDMFSDEDFEFRRQELITSAEDIRRELLEDVNIFQNSAKVVHLANISKPLFQHDDILVFSNDINEVENIKAFKYCLARRSKQFRRIIPGLWKRVMAFVEAQSDKPYLLLSYLRTEFPGNGLLIILRYLHNIGKVLWYEKIEGLSNYIFHQIPAVTDMIALLFNHSADLWEKRVAKFTNIVYEQQIIDKEEYEHLVGYFRESGIIYEAVLMDLLGRDQRFPAEVSFRLLLTFQLIHGPIKRVTQDAFVIPSLSPIFRDNSWESDGYLQLRVDILFRGLLLPKYVSHLVTVLVLNRNSSQTNSLTVFQNGCSIYCGEVAIHLLHDSNSSKVTLQVSTTVALLGSSWEIFLSTTQHILQQTTRVWKAAHPECIFYCSHCLFKRELKPDYEVNPRWFQWHSQDVSVKERTAAVKTFQGVAPVLCRNVWASYRRILEVPMPLRFPCYHLTAGETSKLKHYLLNLELCRPEEPLSDDQTEPQASADVDADGSDSELSDMEDHPDFDFNDRHTSTINLRVQPVRRDEIKALYHNTNRVYRPSDRIRGRVLIININKFLGAESETLHTRVGSKVDYGNLSRLFKEMGFDVAKTEEQLTDLTAEELLKEIAEETEKDVHHRLGVFILVLMSHGTHGDIIYGSDCRPVDLVQIKDLLSDAKFPAMRGKPKLIILEAFSGDHADTGGMKTNFPPNVPSAVSSGNIPPQPQRRLNVDDFFIMKAADESYPSRTHGSLFIRAIVVTLYKHSKHRDMESLFKIIQHRVRELSMREMKRTRRPIGGIVPISQCTFTHFRKLYFFPGYNGVRRKDVGN